MTRNTDNSLKMTATFALLGGEPGEDTDDYNPLTRALTRPLTTGKPDKRLVQCFVVDKRDRSSQNERCIRWLGVFVYSGGSQVIFFPGFAQHMTEVHLVHQTEPELNQYFQFDHFTLEPNLQRWHITADNSSNHISAKISTRSIGNGKYLWFGLTISNLDVLRIAKEITVTTARVPTTDAKRRMEMFLNSKENAVDHILEFHPGSALSDSDAAHFAFIVNDGSGDLYHGNELGLPYSSPYIAEPLDGRLTTLPTRQHLIALSNDRGLQIDTAVLPCKLLHPVVVTSPSD